MERYKYPLTMKISGLSQSMSLFSHPAAFCSSCLVYQRKFKKHFYLKIAEAGSNLPVSGLETEDLRMTQSPREQSCLCLMHVLIKFPVDELKCCHFTNIKSATPLDNPYPAMETMLANGGCPYL